MQTSCLVFKKDALPRRAVIRFVTYPPFELAMLAVILCNCIALALDLNRPGFNQTSLYRSLQAANLFFLAAFTLPAQLHSGSGNMRGRGCRRVT